ncbi:MAG: GLUG motif-containing protein, partial [Bacteroidota bacterium]|nr:GLUG motif-containing protein [Bacteroidota bacterium]
GTFNNNFFDSEASNQSTDALGSATAKTTTEMKCVFTYTDTSYVVSVGLDSAWDFVSNPNDDVNNDDYWDMDQLGTVNSGYPILSWQSGSDDEILKGAGTTGAPYQISDICELALLSNNSSYWGDYFIQTADINASITDIFNISGGDTLGFSPIGNNTTSFTGEYDGQCYIIDSLYINHSGTDYIGLFGYASGAVIDSIGLTNIDITGNIYVGGLVGYNYLFSTIANSYSTGIVSGSYYVGGLVGYNLTSSTITNSYSTGSVSGTNDYVGGLVGWNYSSTITNSYSTGSISGSERVGGFVGYNRTSSTITNSYSTGSVSGSGDNVGGLVGENNSSTVSNSYSTGSVNGNHWVGGLVGYNYDGSTITNSYGTGSVTGTSQVGGLVGFNRISSTITNSYSIGDVTRSSGTLTYFGGFVGYNYNSTVEDCYSTGSVSYTGATDPTDKGFVGYNYSGTYNDNFFDSTASNQSTDAVGSATAKTTAEMKDYNTFTDVSTTGLTTAWDFVTNPNDDANNDDDWDMDQLETVNDGYPILSWQDGADNVLTITAIELNVKIYLEGAYK